ncbi:LysR substrate binding domain protein [compost metagenome]
MPSLSLHALLAPLLCRLPERPPVLLETASLDLGKRLAQQGLGIAFQSRWGLEQEMASGQLVHVPLHSPAPLWCELGVYVRAGRSLPPAVTALVHLLMAELAD